MTSNKELIQQRAQGILIELVATGKKDSILPLIEKQPELLTQSLSNEFVRAAYQAELEKKVPTNYTKELAESIHNIRVEAAKPKEAATGAHTQKARPGQEVR
jgi:hypothetical protein